MTPVPSPEFYALVDRLAAEAIAETHRAAEFARRSMGQKFRRASENFATAVIHEGQRK